GISDQRASETLTSKAGPGNLFYLGSPGQTKKTESLVGHPEISRSIFSEGIHDSTRNPAQNKPIIFKVANTAARGDPTSSVSILKKATWSKSIEFPVRFGAAGLHNRELSSLPPIEASIRSKPSTSIPVGQNGRNAGVRQTLPRTKSGNCEVAKAIETINRN